MKDVAVLTVVYFERDIQAKMAYQTWNGLKDFYIQVVENRNDSDLLYVRNTIDGEELINDIIINDENCLARGWNKGLKKLFKDYKYVIVSGLDSVPPSKKHLEFMRDKLEKYPQLGLVSAKPEDIKAVSPESEVQHGDGSFSFFMISKKCFEDIGDFDENFKPAYFEDNDYLERIWEKGYNPLRLNCVEYTHVFQGSVTFGEDAARNYSKFMQKNLNYFRKKWGFTPPHLPENAKFN